MTATATAAPARFPYFEHRTCAEIAADRRALIASLAQTPLHHAPPKVSVREAPGVAPTASGVVS